MNLCLHCSARRVDRATIEPAKTPLVPVPGYRSRTTASWRKLNARWRAED